MVKKKRKKKNNHNNKNKKRFAGESVVRAQTGHRGVGADLVRLRTL